MTSAETRVASIRDLLAILLRQEERLAALVSLARETQRALIASDFAAVDASSTAMMDAAEALDADDRERSLLATEIGDVDSLESLVAVAEAAGVAEFAPARERLARQAAELRRLQETNARLVLDALKLRERWYALLVGMTPSTYGAAGRQELAASRGIVSRSA